VRDITAARAHALPPITWPPQLAPTLADPGYDGGGIGILIPGKQAPALTASRPMRSWHPYLTALRHRRVNQLIIQSRK